MYVLLDIRELVWLVITGRRGRSKMSESVARVGNLSDYLDNTERRTPISNLFTCENINENYSHVIPS